MLSSVSGLPWCLLVSKTARRREDDFTATSANRRSYHSLAISSLMATLPRLSSGQGPSCQIMRIFSGLGKGLLLTVCKLHVPFYAEQMNCTYILTSQEGDALSSRSEAKDKYVLRTP